MELRVLCKGVCQTFSPEMTTALGGESNSMARTFVEIGRETEIANVDGPFLHTPSSESARLARILMTKECFRSTLGVQ